MQQKSMNPAAHCILGSGPRRKEEDEPFDPYAMQQKSSKSTAPNYYGRQSFKNQKDEPHV
jgi:hypothetical protein